MFSLPASCALSHAWNWVGRDSCPSWAGSRLPKSQKSGLRENKIAAARFPLSFRPFRFKNGVFRRISDPKVCVICFACSTFLSFLHCFLCLSSLLTMAVLQAFVSHIYFSSVSLFFRLLVTVSANFGYEQSVPGIYLGCICGGIIQLKPVARITFS